MNKIYRLTLDGIGIYTNDESYFLISDYQCLRNDPRSPAPRNDSLLISKCPDEVVDSWGSWVGKQYIFGFENKQRIIDWFLPELLEKLDSIGVIVEELEGEVIHGYTQSIILKDSAKLIKSWKLMEFLG